MKLIACEFEEGEYRAPLFNQLHTSNLIWEPGQVFEGYIGIDHAMMTTNAYLHSLFGHSNPIDGVVLSRYRWDYIWLNRKRAKKLPTFRLNVFIQAKRPQYGRYAPKAFRDAGLKSPFWRFDITPHQQLALERLHNNLKNRAIVCYASPAFHKQALLYKWTVQPRMVEESTFPDVKLLQGHSAWNYSAPGATGVANADPTPIQSTPFLQRLELLTSDQDAENESPIESIKSLANAVRASMNDEPEDSYFRARFAESREIIRQIVSYEEPGGRNEEATIAFCEVLLFCYLYKLNWFVAGIG